MVQVLFSGAMTAAVIMLSSITASLAGSLLPLPVAGGQSAVSLRPWAPANLIRCQAVSCSKWSLARNVIRLYHVPDHFAVGKSGVMDWLAYAHTLGW